MISATTATSAPVDQPPDLDGIAGLPDGAQLIWAPADRSNYYSAAQRPYGGVARRQIAICFHTSEESWDDYESAPHWFQEARANASTGYYADSDGDLWQMVRDADFAWAQGARTRDLVLPRPSWWRDDYISYNSCMLSIEIEGRAAQIGDTLRPGGRQFQTLAAWTAFVCRKYAIPVDRTHLLGHMELTRQKRDPGPSFPWSELLSAVSGLISPPSEAQLAALESRIARLERHTHGKPVLPSD